MDTIIMNVTYYLKCMEHGNLKQLLLEDLNPFLHLLSILLHHNNYAFQSFPHREYIVAQPTLGNAAPQPS